MVALYPCSYTWELHLLRVGTAKVVVPSNSTLILLLKHLHQSHTVLLALTLEHD